MEEEKGKWEDIVRSKLYDIETDTNPDDWDIISGKLSSGGKTVTFSPYRRYGYAVAAAVAALMIVGGLYFFNDDKTTDIVAVVEKPVESIEVRTVEKPVEMSAEMVEKATETVEKVVDNTAKTVEKPVNKSDIAIPFATKKTTQDAETDKTDEYKEHFRPLLIGDEINIEVPHIDINTIEKDILYGLNEIKTDTLAIDKTFTADASKDIKRRRWGFGAGGGGYGMGSSSEALGMGLFSSPVNDFDEYMVKNDIVSLRSFDKSLLQDTEDGLKIRTSEIRRGKVKHKMPISAGLGVSYYLNDRWALQSGLTYTMLRSEGSEYSDAGIEWKQKLHFIGVPVSLSYKIAEWNRFQFYATAGGMFEINYAGKLEESIFDGDVNNSTRKKLRMKEPLWSLNTRAGVVYPVWKFINVYAEGGASYYFENKSNIETIRSDKPFNVSLQAGVRLGF